MKRLLMIFMLIAVIACASPVLAEKNSDNAVSVMTSLGIIGEQDEESLEETVTRAEFAEYLCKMLRWRDIGEFFVNGKPYNDVDIWHEAAGSIEYLKTLGIADGTTENNYHPDDTITFGAACKLLVVSAGYTDGYTSAFGTYPEGHIKAAAGLGITDGVALSADAELSMQNAAIMLYNLLDVPYAQFDSVAGNGNIKFDRDETFSEFVMDLYKFRGKLTADSYISLYGENAGENQAVIDGVLYDTQSYYTEYIGMTVEGYAYDSGDSEMEIVWLVPRSSGEVLILTDDDIIKYVGGTYTYYTDSETGKTKNITIPDSAPIVYNYALTGRKDIMKPVDGEVRIVKDKGSVSAVVITEYENFFVTWVDSANKVVETSTGDKIDLSDNDIEYRTPEGRSSSFDSIVKGTVVSLIRNDVDDTRTICIVSNNTETGTVQTMSQDDLGRYTVETDGGVYAVQAESPMLEDGKSHYGLYLKLYLDHEGKVFYAEAVRDESSQPYYRYGYLIKATIDYENDNIIFKLLDQDGQIYRYNLKDKVTVDDDKMNKEAVYHKFLFNDEEKITARQAIRYRVTDGIITKIQTGQAYVEGSKVTDKLLIRANAKRYYYKPNGTFKRLLPINDADRLTPEIIVSKNPVAFMVPPETATTRSFDDSEFKVIKLNSVMSEDKACWIKAYNTDSERLDSELIVYFHEKSYVFDKSNPYLMVTDVDTLYDESQEMVVTRLKGMGNNTTYTFDADNEEFFQPDGYKIKRGDLIRVIKSDVDGFAAALELVFTPDYDGSIMGAKRAFYPTKSGRERNLGYSLIYGRIEKSNNGNISVLYGTGSVQDREYFPVGSIPIYVYDADADKNACVYRGSSEDLKVGARVCIVNFWAKPSYMFVYLRG
ncbi:MAG: S-layer homology domain-containing protein [Clostridia bacterium]|nr:S-layer homology domain-containing protein [Clostridia bacterium]